MLRTLLIFLLSLIIALGSTVFMYKSEVDGMIQMGEEKLDEIINGEKPDDPDDPSGGKDELKVESIALDTTGAKLEFAFGEKFSAEGLKVIATYVDGSKKEIAIEDCKLVKPDTTKPGERQVTVVYEGKSARYNVTVNLKYIPSISSTPLVDIVGKNDSVPYRVEAELIDMVTSGVVKAEGYDSFVAEAPADADITGGDQYLTGYGVAWNYFGFTFTAAEKFEDTTLVLRVANSTGKSIDAGIIKMYLNFSQDENGVPSGEIPLEGYIIPADGACKWMDIVIRNVTIPEGTNTLTFETQKDNAFDIDYVDFYVGMRYVNSVVEIVDSTTIVKDLESLDTEKAFTRNDVANAHGLKPGQLFVETVSKPIDGQVTSGGTSVGAIGKGSQISTTIRVAQDSTVRILFKASSVGHGAYNVADHWNFYIDGVKINIVEVKNIEGGNQAEGQWWDWKYTNIGEINLPAGDHYFLLEVHGTDCNVDTVEFEVVSFGSFDESGTNIEDMYVPEETPEADINIDKKGEFVFEAENLDMSNLTPSAGQTAVGVETPSGDGPATSGGMSLGKAGGGYASFTFKLNDKATIQIYGVLAHAHGGEAATFMSAKLNDTDLALSGTLPVGTGSMPYWNWANIPFGEAVELEAGTYTITVNFLSNPNVDCFKINVLSYGEEEEGFKVTVEAETFDNEGVVTRQDFIDIGKLQAGQYGTETGNGATCIMGFKAGTYFKFNVNLEEAKYIEMFLVGATDAGGYDVSTKFALKVNGNDVVIPSGSLTGSGATPYWDWQTVSLGKFNLNAGDNEIVLTIVDGHPNLDKVFFVEASEEPVTPPAHECESVCPECGKCLDAECAEDACAEKCEGHQVVVTPDITINDSSDSYKVEAEKLDMSTLVPQPGFAKPVEESFDGGKGLGGIGSGGYQSFIVTTEKDVKVNLYISFANAGGGSILSFIPAVSVNDQPLDLIDSQVPAGVGSPQESPSNFYWNVAKVHIAVVELKAGEVYTFKISVNSGNLDGYVLEVVPPHVHTEETIAAVAPTCTATGLTEGKKCSECGETLVAQETVEALGHTEVVDAAVAATCTATGLTEGKHCSVCSEVLVAQTETPKIPHVYDEGDAFDSTCNVCGGVRTCEHANVETVPAKAATCTEPGLTEGKKCSTCGDIVEAQETVEALGHTEVVDAAVAATCTATGLTEGKHCSVCNEVLVAQQTIEALGHTEVVDAAVAATCTATGLTEGKHCSVCSEVLVAQETVEALGHTEVVDAAVAATSATTGLTEGKHCSACGEVFVAQEEIPMLTVNINGTGTYVFEAENLDQTHLVPASGHANVKFEYPNQADPATSNGASIGACGGGYTTITFVLEEKATVQIYGRLAHAHGGAASKYMTVMLGRGMLEATASLPAGNGNSQYWNWADIPFGGALDLEAGTYTITIRFNSNPNVDCFKFEVLTYGEFVEPEADVTIDGTGKYTYEAENVDKSSLVLRQDFININKYAFTEGWSNDFGAGSCLMGYTSGSVIKLYVDVKEATTLDLMMRMSYYSAATFDFSNTTITFAGKTLTPVPAGEFGHREASDYWMWVDVSLGQVEVEAGMHLFEINFTECDNHNIDYFAFTTIIEDAPACESICATCGLCTDANCFQADHLTKCEGHFDVVISGNEVYTLEAENWSQEHMTLRSDLANHAAKNGNRLLENNGTTIGGMAAGSYIEFKVNVQQDSTIAFIMKAAHSLSFVINDAISLTVDGVAVELSNNDILGSGSAPWFDWTIFTMGYADLSAGEHTIVLTFTKISCNIDYLKLDVMSYGSYCDSDVTVAAEGTTRFELETLDCTQCLITPRSDFLPSVGAGNFGHNGVRVYGYIDGSIFRIVVTVEQACTLEIKLAGYGGTALNKQQYYFGGTEIIPAADAVLGTEPNVVEGLVGTVQVDEPGVYVFEFTSGGSTDLDYVSFTVVQ